MTELGRLKQEDDLRQVWKKEAQDFTPWLARDENIAVLAGALGMDLEVEAQEKDVGPFRADILCRDMNSPERDSWVLIENQLERTDHTHLGQLLTYGAGLDTVTIIWIAKRFTEEHRAALDWLNEITDERHQFFGLEVELWRIGKSPLAPKFNVVSKPNEWVAGAKRAVSGEVSETGQLYQRYWAAFLKHLDNTDSSLRGPRTPGPRTWLEYPLGKSDFWLSALLGRRDRLLSVTLSVGGPDRIANMSLLEEKRGDIESLFGHSLEWRTSRKTGQIIFSYPKQVDVDDESDWPHQHKWLADTLARFDEVFRPLVKELDAADWDGTPAGDA